MVRTPHYPMGLTSPNLNHRYVYIPSSNKTHELVHYHILMITGNPGCIGYYHDFLTLLSNYLADVSPNARISIYGTSLSGFVNSVGKKEVLTLQGQIQFVEDSLSSYIARHVVHDTRIAHKVIVVGHSVGAYIGLEVIRRHRERSKAGGDRGYQIIGYLGLWPTVTDIVTSKRGQRAGWLLQLPFFAYVTSLVVRLLMLVMGRSLLVTLLKLAGFPEQSAYVTADFVASRNGVYQALYMAKDEMNEISSDRWDDDIWGATSPAQGAPRPKMVFYFGQDDHWVADHSRDELIKSRGWYEGGDDWRPRMLIDDLGIPHSFCISHSDVAARKSAAWIAEMLQHYR